MSVLVSVIVPVFNVENYLDICIKSVLSQSYKYWELILVDDGSIDRSNIICDYYALSDDRIRVIHKKNSGVSNSRNIAIDIAQGEYVMFLDADDYWCENNVIEQLLGVALKDKLDIVRGEYIAVDENNHFVFSRKISNKRRIFSNTIIGSYEFLQYAISDEFFLPLSLFKRDVIGNIRLEEKRIFLEDMQFYSEILLKEMRCMYLPDFRFYSYRKNINSASYRVNPRKIIDSFGLCYFFHDISCKAKDLRIKRIYQNKSLTMYYCSLDNLAYDPYYFDRNKYVNDCQLYELKRKISKWMLEYGLLKFSLIYRVPPLLGVKLLRIKHKFMKILDKLYYIKHRLKLFLCKLCKNSFLY